jgi:adenylate kinase
MADPWPALAPARIIVLGRPGSGKGTQGALVSDALGVPHISTGDLLRDEIGRGTRLGGQIGSFVRRGRLVPDPLVAGLLRARLDAADVRANGFLLDGFPRSVAQAVELERSVAAAPITVAVELLVSQREAAQRLLSRFVCATCGRSPHRAPGTEAPALTDRCAACGGTLRRRADDETAVVQRRFDEFESLTKPLLDWLDRRGVLVTVAADAMPTTVTEELLGALAPVVTRAGACVDA